MFYNYTNEPFVAKWGGCEYTIPAGAVRENMVISDDKVNSVLVTNVVARVWGHHLAQKVLNTPKLNQNFKRDSEGKLIPTTFDMMMTHNYSSVQALIERAVTMPEVARDLPEQLNDLPLLKKEVDVQVVEPEEVQAEQVAKKRSPGRPKKEEASPSPEAVFDV